MKFHEALKFGTPDTGIKTFCGPCTVESVGDLKGLTGLSVSEAQRAQLENMSADDPRVTVDGLQWMECYRRWCHNRAEIETGGRQALYVLTDDQIAAAKAHDRVIRGE